MLKIGTLVAAKCGGVLVIGNVDALDHEDYDQPIRIRITHCEEKPHFIGKSHWPFRHTVSIFENEE